MNKPFQVVDIFAGPGGLAEGFASVTPDGESPFRIALSVEKEPSAHATLTLRHFLRHFPQGLPSEYYRGILDPDIPERLRQLYPSEWKAAEGASLRLELGTPGVQAILDPILDRIRENSNGSSILVGGPPCQAYSLVGRARNKGNISYVARDDHRHYLYREYIHILRRLQPAAFVMENVKGILSATVDGVRIFDLVLDDLRSACGPDSYVLVPLSGRHDLFTGKGSDFLVRSEDHGIPQCRHRVIVLGLRRDVATAANPHLVQTGGGLIAPSAKVASSDVIEPMSPLRSGLSGSQDLPEAWRSVVRQGMGFAAEHATAMRSAAGRAVSAYLYAAAEELASSDLMPRTSSRIAPVRNNRLADWLLDPQLDLLPNHHSRSHMAADLARYAFVAAFGQVMGRSPRASEFPSGLAPAHRNWASGKFADRFKVQLGDQPSSTITSHISKDGHYFIHPDPLQCRSLTVREAARLQTFPDNYLFLGNRTQQYVQVGNAVPPLLAKQIGEALYGLLRRDVPGAGGKAQAA